MTGLMSTEVENATVPQDITAVEITKSNRKDVAERIARRPRNSKKEIKDKII
jgi:hypothetical protein